MEIFSGLLLSYTFFGQHQKQPVKNPLTKLLKMILNRYLRLTPILLILIMITMTASMILNDVSQFHQVENYEHICKTFWWRNLLYIQNLFPLSEVCISWTWYLAADFQLFCVCSLLLVIFTK